MVKKLIFLLLPIISLNAELSKETIQKLIRQYGPLVKLHSAEGSSPTSVDWYLQRCSLKQRLGSELSKNMATLVQKGRITLKSLGNIYAFKGTNRFYFLDPENDAATLKGEGYENGFAKASCYVNVIEQGDTGVVLQFWFFYANQPAVAPNIPLIDQVTKLLDIGIHEGDWEHINIYLKKYNGQLYLQSVFFGRHGESKGELLDADEFQLIDDNLNPVKIDFTNDEKDLANSKVDQPKNIEKLIKAAAHGLHPVVYAAKNSHGTYPEVMVNLDFDATDDKGNKWKCWEKGIPLGTREKPELGQEWIKFLGRWGATVETKAFGVQYHGNSPETPSFQDSYFNTLTMKHLETKLEGNFVSSIPVSSQIKEKKRQSARYSDYFDLLIPARMINIAWHFDLPQPNVSFEIWEKKTLVTDIKWFEHKAGEDKSVPIPKNMPRKAKNLYVANVKNSKGIPLLPFSVYPTGQEN